MTQFLVKIKNHKLCKQVVAKVIAADEAEARELVTIEASLRVCSFANPHSYNKEWVKWDAWNKEHLPSFSGVYWTNAEYVVVRINNPIISLEWDNL